MRRTATEALSADGLRVVLEPQANYGTSGDGRSVRDANAHLHLDAGLNVGYGGFYQCEGTCSPNLSSR